MLRYSSIYFLDLYYNAMKQVDDGRPGMALELGVNIFADGNPVLNVCPYFPLFFKYFGLGYGSPAFDFVLYTVG